MNGDEGHPGPVELLFSEYTELTQNATKNSPSDLSALNSVYAKSILIASASNLEAEFKSSLERCFRELSGAETAEFLRRKVLDRGYHTLFNWDANDARAFFGQFGEESKARFRSYCSDDPQWDRQAAFISLGRDRNRLVHNDYATVYLEKTPEEIIELYRKARAFLAEIPLLALGKRAIEPVL